MTDRMLDYTINAFLAATICLVVAMVVATVFNYMERSAARDACVTLGGVPVSDMNSIVCLEKSVVKTP